VKQGVKIATTAKPASTGQIKIVRVEIVERERTQKRLELITKAHAYHAKKESTQKRWERPQKPHVWIVLPERTQK
tara:strand:- start:22335 stop:22559 length:225 start_codon:yes stop_codon:yes gene_type:complete